MDRSIDWLIDCQVRCVAEAVYRQDAMQLQDLCGITNIRDQRAVQRKVKVNECSAHFVQVLLSTTFCDVLTLM